MLIPPLFSGPSRVIITLCEPTSSSLGHGQTAAGAARPAQMADATDNRLSQGAQPGRLDLTLRGWAFCGAHGLEQCRRCAADHRGANNARLEAEFGPGEMRRALLVSAGARGLADRRPLSVAGKYVMLPGGTAACMAHSTVGCGACFDFKAQVMQP
ncbi:MAG: hypothetical protein J3K34DRAFT_410266 [Monoraphidium minutum]|nr:MAG: hypothetical protein J3K34DRAFT_410266 [Monoraphidium minutum]